MSNAEASAPTPAKKEKNEEVISMQDGSKVTFAGKKQITKASEIDAEGNILIKFNFRNGDVRVLRFEATDPILYRLAAHGAEQKFGDEMAASSDKYSLEDRIMWFDELAERMTDTGKDLDSRWFAERESGGGIGGVSTLVRALMELRGKTAEEVKAILNREVERLGVSKQKLVEALRNNPAIKPTVDRLEAEKAAKSTAAVDVESVLAAM